MGLALFVRPSFILLTAPLSLSWYLLKRDTNTLVELLIGFLISILLYMGVGYQLWGTVFSSSYHWVPEFNYGMVVIAEHPIGFNWSTLLSDWQSKLFGEQGIFPYNACILLLPLVIMSLSQLPFPALYAHFLVIATIYTLYIFSYQMWSATGLGNRFLLVAVYLYGIPCVSFMNLSVQRLEEWLRTRSLDKKA